MASQMWRIDRTTIWVIIAGLFCFEAATGFRYSKPFAARLWQECGKAAQAFGTAAVETFTELKEAAAKPDIEGDPIPMSNGVPLHSPDFARSHPLNGAARANGLGIPLELTKVRPRTLARGTTSSVYLTSGLIPLRSAPHVTSGLRPFIAKDGRPNLAETYGLAHAAMPRDFQGMWAGKVGDGRTVGAIVQPLVTASAIQAASRHAPEPVSR
jgi:hypothetical protein